MVDKMDLLHQNDHYFYPTATASIALSIVSAGGRYCAHCSQIAGTVLTEIVHSEALLTHHSLTRSGFAVAAVVACAVLTGTVLTDWKLTGIPPAHSRTRW